MCRYARSISDHFSSIQRREFLPVPGKRTTADLRRSRCFMLIVTGTLLRFSPIVSLPLTQTNPIATTQNLACPPYLSPPPFLVTVSPQATFDQLVAPFSAGPQRFHSPTVPPAHDSLLRRRTHPSAASWEERWEPGQHEALQHNSTWPRQQAESILQPRSASPSSILNQSVRSGRGGNDSESFPHAWRCVRGRVHLLALGQASAALFGHQ